MSNPLRSPATREFGGKIFKLWFTGNTADGKDGPSHRLIRKHGGVCKEVKLSNGDFAFYYRGVNIDKIPQKAFHDTSLFD